MREEEEEREEKERERERARRSIVKIYAAKRTLIRMLAVHILIS